MSAQNATSAAVALTVRRLSLPLPQVTVIAPAGATCNQQLTVSLNLQPSSCATAAAVSYNFAWSIGGLSVRCPFASFVAEENAFW